MTKIMKHPNLMAPLGQTIIGSQIIWYRELSICMRKIKLFYRKALTGVITKLLYFVTESVIKIIKDARHEVLVRPIKNLERIYCRRIKI